ncbi:protein MpC3H4 [Marchantia polymorpha subsp. ruderalis]
MSRRQEICRDFQRGSCRYGTRCKFLHQTNAPQQPRQPQNNQNQRNAFGGAAGNNYYGALGNNNNNNNNNHSQRHNTQSSVAAKEHKCNNPRLCKDQIEEDFQNEHPVFWRLTCYAHYKFLPNDIVGDVSPEELRAIAYDSAKQGLSLKDVAQREASMFAAKNAEFEALRRNPYKGPASQGSATPFSPFSASPFMSSPASQNNSSAMVSGQPLTLSNPNPAAGQGFAQNPNIFGAPAARGFSFGQPSVGSGDTIFGPRPSTQNPSPFGVQQPNVFQQTPFQQSPFTNTASPPAVAQPAAQTQSPFTNVQAGSSGVQSPFGFNSPFTGFPSNPGSTRGFASPPGNSPSLSATPAPSLVNTSTVPVPVRSTNADEDAKWFKDVWKIGEIPEGEPPVQVRY